MRLEIVIKLEIEKFKIVETARNSGSNFAFKIKFEKTILCEMDQEEAIARVAAELGRIGDDLTLKMKRENDHIFPVFNFGRLGNLVALLNLGEVHLDNIIWRRRRRGSIFRTVHTVIAVLVTINTVRRIMLTR